MTILDAGCGHGRNLVFFLQQGYEVCGIDPDSRAIDEVQALARKLRPDLPRSNFRAEAVESNTFPDDSADVVVSNAVLHFARDREHFEAMLRGAWSLVKPGGVFFCRLASSIGMEPRMQPLGNGRFLLPDGSERFLVDEAYLLELTTKADGTLIDPLKTTIVQDRRCMTTWVMQKKISPLPVGEGGA